MKGTVSNLLLQDLMRSALVSYLGLNILKKETTISPN